VTTTPPPRLFAQSRPAGPVAGRAVRGLVTDRASRLPLAGVSVRVPALGRGALTEADGHYQITGLPAGVVTVQLRYIGYAPVTRQVDLTRGDATLDVALQPIALELTRVTVTDSATARDALRSEQSVATMSAADVARERGQTLGETMKQLPGVTVIQYGPSIAKPVIRGLHSQRLVVMNNGVPQEGQQWGAEHAPEIDAFAANEIQVIRGTGAVLYGSNALGGVVRVDPRPLPTEGLFDGNVSVNTFSNNRQGAASLLLEGVLPSLPLVGDLGWRGQASSRVAGDAASPTYNLRNTGFRELDYNAALGITRPWGTSALSFSHFGTDLGIYTGSHVGNLDDLERAMRRGPRETEFSYGIGRPNQLISHNLLSWRTQVDLAHRAQLEVDYGYQHNERREFDNHGPLAARDRPAFGLGLTTYTLDVRARHAPIGPMIGTFGVSGMRQGNVTTGKSFLIPQYRLYTGAVYGMEEVLLDRWTLSAGVRYDSRWQRIYRYRDQGIISPDERRTYSDYSGSLGATYRLTEDWSIAGTVGRAWRAPNVSERFSQGVHHGTAQYEIGDSSLVPERSLNVDATLRHVGDRVQLEVSGFQNRIADYIYLRPRAPVLTIRGAFPGFNYAHTDALLRGFDASAQVAVAPRLSLEATASLVRGTDRANGDPLYDMPADRLTAALRYSASGSARIDRPYLEIGTTLVRKQDQVPPVTVYRLPTAGYGLLNAEVGAAQLHLFGTPLTASLAVRNLLGKRYRDYLSRYKLFVDEPGRDVVLRLEVPLGAPIH
jgi:iron complex outermembrane receptor protein